MAERFGSSEKHLQRIEAGLENLTLRTIDNLAVALETSAPDLLRMPIDATRRIGRPRRPVPVPTFEHVRLTPATVNGAAVPMLTLVTRDESTDQLGVSDLADWVRLPGKAKSAGLFVARIVGAALAPAVPASGLLVLRSAPRGDVDGKTVLVEQDGENGAATYLLRRARSAGGEGAAARVRLEGLTKERAARTLNLSASMRIVAEVVEIVAEAPAS